MNQFQSKQTMKKKIGGGFFGRIARSFHARKESKCKRKADDIINKCIIHNNENNNANNNDNNNDNNNANLYTNISLCIYPDGNFYYVNHNKRQYIYHKLLMSEEFWDMSHTFFATKHNNEFPYIFITKRSFGLSDNSNPEIKIKKIQMIDVQPKLFDSSNLLCIPCDMFGLIPNDAYSNNINLHMTAIENWSEFISKKKVQLNLHPPNNNYLINLLSDK
jgi:hypothetical protein